MGAPSQRQLPQGAAIRFGLFVALVLAAAAATRFTPLGEFLDQETLLATLGKIQEAWWAPLLLVALYLTLCPLGLPATPLMVAGAVLFGARWGSVVNVTGVLSSAMAGYFLARRLGADFVQHFVGRGRLRRLERRLTRRGFWPMVGIRFMPIPFPVVNFGMALAGIRPTTYALTSALGLTPAVLLWTFFSAAVYQAASGETAGLIGRLAVGFVLLLGLVGLPAILKAKARKKRFAEIQTQRRKRKLHTTTNR